MTGWTPSAIRKTGREARRRGPVVAQGEWANRVPVSSFRPMNSVTRRIPFGLSDVVRRQRFPSGSAGG